MIEEVREMLNEKASLEREYLELVHISDEMNLSAEIYDKMMMANIAHSLSVIADALADRKTEPQRNMAEDIVRSFGFKSESYRQAKAKDEPQMKGASDDCQNPISANCPLCSMVDSNEGE